MLVVQKYGGTSVADLGRIRNVARRVLGLRREGNQVVVVVSAMAGETDRLIKRSNQLLALVRGGEEGANEADKWVAHQKSGDADHERELSQLISTGEKVSAALLAIAIQELGGRAISFVGHQLGLQTERRFTNARIKAIENHRIQDALAEGKVVVCAGFQGTDPEGNITTLGRGGTDTSAVAVAAALNADSCEILTDVDGVYTTDPRVVPHARKLDRISYEEMIELASLGAKVLQIRSVEFAMKYRVPLHVRTSLSDAPGTIITGEESEMESVMVRGVALDRNEAKVTVTNCPDVPGTVAEVFGRLGDAGIVVDMIIQNAGRKGRADVTFTVPDAELERAVELLGGVSFAGEEGVEVLTDPDICKLSIVGVGMRTHAGVAAKAFSILAKERVNVQMVSTSEIKVSVVIAERYGELALRALHDGFELGESTATQS